MDRQIQAVGAERWEEIRASEHPSVEQVRALLKLRGMGENGAWLLVKRFFAWRGFRNRREVGDLAGLTPARHHGGEESRDQGISQAGNRPIRAMAIEIAWVSWPKNVIRSGSCRSGRVAPKGYPP